MFGSREEVKKDEDDDDDDGALATAAIRGDDYGGKKRTINILLNTSIDLHTFLQPQHNSTDGHCGRRVAVFGAQRCTASFGDF